MFGFPEEADGRKGPLLEPKLQFLVESRPRKEVHSGSLWGALRRKREAVELPSAKPRGPEES